MCWTDVDCAYLSCDPARRVCVDPSKPCAENCTGYGDCYHVMPSTGATLNNAACVVGTANCGAKCACKKGWHDGSCGVDNETSGATIAIVDDLISVVDDASAMR